MPVRRVGAPAQAPPRLILLPCVVLPAPGDGPRDVVRGAGVSDMPFVSFRLCGEGSQSSFSGYT